MKDRLISFIDFMAVGLIVYSGEVFVQPAGNHLVGSGEKGKAGALSEHEYQPHIFDALYLFFNFAFHASSSFSPNALAIALVALTIEGY